MTQYTCNNEHLDKLCCVHGNDIPPGTRIFSSRLFRSVWGAWGSGMLWTWRFRVLSRRSTVCFPLSRPSSQLTSWERTRLWRRPLTSGRSERVHLAPGEQVRDSRGMGTFSPRLDHVDVEGHGNHTH